MKTLVQNDTCVPKFNVALFTKPRYGSNLGVHWQMNKMCACVCTCAHTHMHTTSNLGVHWQMNKDVCMCAHRERERKRERERERDYSAIRKEWNFSTSKNMEEPRGYYAKWNNADEDRQILHVFTYMWNLKICLNQKQTPLIQRKN